MQSDFSGDVHRGSDEGSALPADASESFDIVTTSR